VPAGVTFAFALALYVRTLLPDVGTWDTAEFQAIGPVLGIAHPTGFPSYTLLAWLASVVLQPFGNEAYRADLLSALLVAGAAALTAVATVQLTRRAALGLLAGVAFAVLPVAWRVGVRADAHALHIVLTALILVLLIEWRRREVVAGGRRPGAWLLAAAVVFGLSLGNHALTLLLVPGIAVYVLLVEPRILWRRWRLVLACVAAIAIVTIAVYAYIPLRSSMDPPLDYASPRTPERFWYLVLGQQFQGSIRTLPPIPEIVGRAWTAVATGYGPLALLAALGLGLGLVRHAREIALTALWFVGAWTFALGYANAAIERYYLVPLLVAALWAALGLDVLWDAIWAGLRRLRAGAPGPPTPDETDADEPRSGRFVAGALVAGIIGGLVLAAVPGRFASLDASDERFGRVWLEATLQRLEPDAAVVSWWSFSTPLWYGRWVEGRRPDILIIDDRDVLDDGYGTASGAIDRWLPERPVYLIRLARDLPPFVERYVLERVDGVPSPGDLYRVVGRRPGT
jgi:hypothetical protein